MFAVIPVRAADLPVVDTDKLRRGHTIKARREAHEIRSLRQFAEVSGVDRRTLGQIEAGLGSPDMLTRVEGFLDRLDAGRGIDTTQAASTEVIGEESSQLEPGVIEAVIDGPTVSQRWKVTYRAHEETMPKLTDEIARLVRALEEPND